MGNSNMNFNEWFTKYAPKCAVCGSVHWDRIEEGVAFQKPNDISKQLAVTSLICRECGNMLLINNNY